MNRFDKQVSIYQRGVSSVADTPLRVVIPAHNPGEGHLEPLNATGKIPDGAYTAIISTITLDRVAQDLGWLTPKAASMIVIPLLKLDVEGHEPYIIAGAKQLLCSGLVQNVLLEFNRMQEKESQKAIETLLTCGFVAVNHDDNVLVKKTREETKPYLKEVEDFRIKTGRNTDLWFQHSSVTLPELQAVQ
jgi:hypothetical protein